MPRQEYASPSLFAMTVMMVASMSIAMLLIGCADRRRDTRSGNPDGGTMPGVDGGMTPGMDGGGMPGMDGGMDPVDGGSPAVDGGRGVDGGRPTMDGGGPPRDGGHDGGRPTMDGGGTPGTTIGMIQRGTIPTDTLVTIRNVAVTAVYSGGAWVQDPAGGATYSGIRVYLGAAPAAAIGDRVDVMGTYIEYFDDSEIDSATLTPRGAGTPIAPVAVTATTAATEPYEGVLVRVSGSVTSFAYDCFADDVGCSDASLWEIGGSSGVLAFNYIYGSGDWSSRIGTVPVTGVMSWRYNRRRLMPRSTGDF